MRITTIVAGALSIVLGIAYLTCATAGPDERPHCSECGMFADASSARIQAVVVELGKTTDREYCGVGCLFDSLQAGGGKGKLKSLLVLDYASAGKKTPRFIDGKTAWYLYGTSDLQGSMPPYVAAFPGKEAAAKAQKDLGGELVQGWDDLSKRLAADAEKDASSSKVASKEAPAPPATVYVCPCTGGCCDDIHSDQPGECPKCGMQLVPQGEKDAG